jgi:predicted dehydrogenase
MADRPVRIGIIGCGDVLDAYMAIGGRLREQGLIEVVAACARTNSRRNEVQKKYGVASFTTDYRELIGSDDIDLVLVLTPAQVHGEMVRSALKAGKHVLVEKPMAVTLEEAAQIVELSKKCPGHLICAPFVLLSPTYQTMWHLVSQGKIGKINSARALYGWAGPWWSKWFYQPGGGALFDFAVYNITSLTGFLGPAKQVTAMSGTAVPKRTIDGRPIQVEVEDNAHVVIDFGQATYALVSTGFTMQRYRRPAIELYGDKGTLQMLGDDWAPQGFELWQNSTGAWKIYQETDPFWQWTEGLRHIIECIRQDKAPICSAEQAYHVLEIMIRAKESGRDGTVKAVTSTFTLPDMMSAPDLVTRSAHLDHDPRGRR